MTRERTVRSKVMVTCQKRIQCFFPPRGIPKFHYQRPLQQRNYRVYSHYCNHPGIKSKVTKIANIAPALTSADTTKAKHATALRLFSDPSEPSSNKGLCPWSLAAPCLLALVNGNGEHWSSRFPHLAPLVGRGPSFGALPNMREKNTSCIQSQ
jgi:hypothetical protein